MAAIVVKKTLALIVLVFLVISFLPCLNSEARPTHPSDKYLIRPGISVGEINIGDKRAAVRSIAGKPVWKFPEGDQYSDYSVHYVNDLVSEIIVTSSKYKTNNGISIKTTPKQFLSHYPDAKVTCSASTGAASTTKSNILDATDHGIALGRDTFQGRSLEVISTLTIHRKDVALTIYGMIRPCEAS